MSRFAGGTLFTVSCGCSHAYSCVIKCLVSSLQVFDLVWNQFEKERDADGAVLPSPRLFVTFGIKHCKFWKRDLDGKGGDTYKSTPGKFGAAAICNVVSACFLPKGWLVTGVQTGDLYLWDVTGHKGGLGCVMQVGAQCCWGQSHEDWTVGS